MNGAMRVMPPNTKDQLPAVEIRAVCTQYSRYGIETPNRPSCWRVNCSNFLGVTFG
jgi:hypothetical protein